MTNSEQFLRSSACIRWVRLPVFESGDNRFCARLTLTQSEEFGEFLRRRSASLGNMDELVVEPASTDRSRFRLSAAIRYDISNAFRSDQLDLDLFGESVRSPAL
jgi:hypothetical protein